MPREKAIEERRKSARKEKFRIRKSEGLVALGDLLGSLARKLR